MTLLLIGLALLIAIHLIPAMPGVRAAAIARFGDAGYRMLFSVVAVLGVVFLAMGMGRAEHIPLWAPATWMRDLAPVLMGASVLLVTAAYLPGNLRRLVRNPMLWGVIIWAVAHLLVSGHVAAVLLFGGIGGYAAYAVFFRGGYRSWQAAVPRPWPWDLLTLVVAGLAYGLLVFAHPHLFGVAIV